MVTNVGKPFEVVKSARGLSWDETIIAPYPRLDPFFVDVKDAEIRTNTAQLEDVRARAENTDFVVYAPTWRRAGGYVNGSPLAEVQPDFKQVDQVLDDYECQLLITPHPAEPLDIQYEQYDNIDQLAEGDDIYPFLAYCEVLITDYSSLLYDFSVTNRPMLFYAPDIDEYERTRGLYFEYREHVPGPISESTEELTAHLRTVLNGEDDYNKERVALKQEYYDGLTERPSKQAFQQIVTAVEN